MGQMKNLTGQQFNRWTVLYLSENKTSDGRPMWHCKCQCGNEKDVPSKVLLNGHSQSCGCLRREKISLLHTKDLIGQKFGRLTVLERVGSTDQNKATWKCKCECGNEIIVPTGSLTSGNTTSCGCYMKERIRQTQQIHLEGQKFGLLTVIKELPISHRGCVVWLCQCDCGNSCETITTDLTSGSKKSCGCLSTSVGEGLVQKILKENNIEFEPQKKFDDCRFPDTNYHARFDFFINNAYIIEYDGEQHFVDKKNIGWDTTLEEIQKKDAFKNKWCKEHNIPLIRIPYTHLNALCLEDLLLETSQFIVT